MCAVSDDTLSCQALEVAPSEQPGQLAIGRVCRLQFYARQHCFAHVHAAARGKLGNAGELRLVSDELRPLASGGQ